MSDKVSHKFQPGELVNVRLDGVRIGFETSPDRVHLDLGEWRGVKPYHLTVPLDLAVIERVAPQAGAEAAS